MKLKYLILIAAAMLFVAAHSQQRVLADPASSTQSTTSSSTPNNGVNAPTGADASTYTYDPTTGLWVNQYYTWNPVTKLATPITPLVYTYDTTTGLWDTEQWVWDAATSHYVQQPLTVATPPAGAQTIGGPTATNGPNSISNAGPGSNNSASSTNGGSSTISNTGAGSNNTASNSNSNNANLNGQTSATVNNTITGTAQSGNAAVSANTQAGSATTGSAEDVATILNELNSLASLTGGNVSNFIADITGNVQGNITIDPQQIAQALAADPNLSTQLTNLQVNDSTAEAINNYINILANSGDASVTKNTTAGDAVSGDASAVANVINLLDSLIAANQSFVGIINIYGNLNGNILLPPGLLDSVLGSNAGPNTNNTITNNNGNTTNTTSTSTNTNLNLANNVGINNTTSASATSGAANVEGNTEAGNASTGQAATNVTFINLTGDQVIGANTLLVFVNVLGQWIGYLMNAPAGSTAVAYGGGISGNSLLAGNSSITSNTTQDINNNIDVAAASGNASVLDNTQAGNATSGNADAAINLLNIANSTFDMSNWFGVLFINVFGSWDGNFGWAATPAGNPASQTNQSSTQTQTSGPQVLAVVVSYLPGSGGNSFLGNNQMNDGSQIILASANTTGHNRPVTPTATSTAIAHNDHLTNYFIGGSLLLTGLIFFTADQVVRRRAKSAAATGKK